MKVSILIAHYNNADYFKDCYHSLIQQSYSNWEAIILDDASRKEERDAVKKLVENDERFDFYENSENSGVGITKSKLIELATGDICGFVDPDDAILPNAIKDAVDVFQNYPSVVLAYSKFMKCDENLKPIAAFQSARQVPNNDKYFFNYPVQIAHLVMFRKATYNETEKMNSDLKIAEDQDLYLKLYEKGQVKYIDQANYLYRTHGGGISQNDNKKSSHDYFAKVILATMKRRNITDINGKKVPENYSNAKEIFDLLTYQNSISFRILKKLKVITQRFS